MNSRSLWIVLANGEYARVMTPTSKGSFHTEKDLESPAAHQHGSSPGSERPTRTMESATGVRHAIAPRTDLHEKAKHEFARQVAAEINRASARKLFDAFVLIAPIDTENEIRDALDASAALKLVATLRKDLIKVPYAKLAPHLEEWALRD